MIRTKKPFITLLIPVSLCFAGISLQAFGASTATTVISAQIVGGACNIVVPPTINVSNGDPIPAEDITATSDISESFNLTLSGCNGYGLTPSITIVGDSEDTSGKDLFVSPTSTSKGYGILLSTAGNTNFNSSENLAIDKTISAQTKTWGTTLASTLNGTIPLKAAVSCGTCTANDLQGGELKASLTFNFLYN